MGARSAELEATYSAFKARKAETEARLASLKAAASTAQRLNKAVRAGRVPSLVVDLLNKLEDSGLANHFMGFSVRSNIRSLASIKTR